MCILIIIVFCNFHCSYIARPNPSNSAPVCYYPCWQPSRYVPVTQAIIWCFYRALLALLSLPQNDTIYHFSKNSKEYQFLERNLNCKLQFYKDSKHMPMQYIASQHLLRIGCVYTADRCIQLKLSQIHFSLAISRNSVYCLLVG